MGLSQYFQSASVPELELLSQSEPEMSSAKRARSSSSAGASTTSAYARRRAPVAPSVKKYVKGCMDRLLELKSFNGPVTDTVASGAGAACLIPIEDIIQVDTDDTREGNIIHVKRIVFRYTVFDTVPGLVRIIWFIDRQSNGATPTVTQVLNAANPVSYYNSTLVIGHGGARFSILGDETRALNPGYSGAAQILNVAEKEFKMNMPVTYLASTGAASDVGTNNVWCFVLGNTGTATVRHNCQIQYTDN